MPAWRTGGKRKLDSCAPTFSHITAIHEDAGEATEPFDRAMEPPPCISETAVAGVVFCCTVGPQRHKVGQGSCLYDIR